jgi:hypothetical protein
MNSQLPVILLFMLLLSACSPPDPAIKVIAQSPDLRQGDIAIIDSGREVLLTIRSPRGIGHMKIAPGGEKWPESVRVRLHLKGLESLSLSDAQTTIQASISSHEGHAQSCEISDTKGPLTADHKDWMPIELVNQKQPGKRVVPLENGYFELSIPKRLLQSKNVEIRWIDFFRH